MNPLVLSCSISAATYASTKFLSFMASYEEDESPLDCCGIRETLTEVAESSEKFIGERNWSIFGSVCWDNSWITAFVMTLFVANTTPALTVAFAGKCIALFVGTSITSWAIKHIVGKTILLAGTCLTAIAQAAAACIAPREIED